MVRTDYQKIDIYIASPCAPQGKKLGNELWVYVGSTTWSRNGKEAKTLAAHDFRVPVAQVRAYKAGT